MKKADQKTMFIVEMGILLAIILLFAFTNLGYMKFGLIEITLMCLPVAIGAIVTGPLGGAILGLAFGLTSFFQCFGMSVFGTFIFNISPIKTAVVCILPRILCGLLPGLLFQALQKIDRTKIASFFVAALATALLNTVLFTGTLLLLFWHADGFTQTMSEWGMDISTVWLFVVSFVGLNGIIEAAVNVFLAGSLSKVIVKATERLH